MHQPTSLKIIAWSAPLLAEDEEGILQTIAPWDRPVSVGDSAGAMFGSTSLLALGSPDVPWARVGSSAEDLAEATGLEVAASPSALPSPETLRAKLKLLLQRIEILEDQQLKTTALLMEHSGILRDQHQQMDAVSDTLIQHFEGTAATLQDWLTSQAHILRRRQRQPKRVDAHSVAAVTDEALTQVASVTKRGRRLPKRSHAESVAAPLLLLSAITPAKSVVASETDPATRQGPGCPKRIKIQEAGRETPKASVTTSPARETVTKEAVHVEDTGESSQQQYFME